MIEAEGTLAILQALEEPAETSRLEDLLREPDLSRMFPAVGISRSRGLGYLEAVRHVSPRENLDETGREVLSYFEELIQRRNEFESLLRDLRANESTLVATAFERTRRFLPGSCVLGAPRLVFLPIGFDFRADRETVYMDPLAALQYGLAGIRDTLSHELHHVARYRLTGENLTLMRPEEGDSPTDVHAVFREWASWLEGEGIADCVWNMTQTEIPALQSAVRKRCEQMAEFAKLLERSLVRFRESAARRSKSPSEWGVLRDDLRGLAHPVGACIAQEILNGLGRRSLVQCVGHPRAFLERYNMLAEKRKLTAIDGNLVDWLSED